MTLNMTVLTPHIIYQSADFRLTDCHTSNVVTDQSDKLVSLAYPSWSGFVTYTGIGSLNDRPISAYISEWLSGRDDLEMAAAAEILRSNGSAMLSSVVRRGSVPAHTFILAGFTRKRPRAYIVSNFERWEGATSRPTSAKLHISAVSARDASKLIVTGWKPALTAADRRRLERIIHERRDGPDFVRYILAEENRRAAESPQAANMISPDCIVYSFDELGSGRSRRSDGVPGMARHLSMGTDLTGLWRGRCWLGDCAIR